MLLSTRLTVALTLATLVVFAVAGYWEVERQSHELSEAAARDARLLGRSLQVSFENALRDRQAADLQETLHELDAVEPNVDVYVYDLDGTRIAASEGAPPRPDEPPRPPVASDVHFVPEDDPELVEVITPLRIDPGSGPTATLVVQRPLDSLRSQIRATRLRVALWVLAFVAVVALLTTVLARYWVARPLARMVREMTRVRAGDLSPPSEPERHDEVGATLTEFAALVRDLREARQRLAAEAETRQRLEQGLRQVDKLVTVGQLAAQIAHEIGSPLQILEGRLASLQSCEDDPETVRVATILLDQTRRITRIVSRLVGVARRRAGTPLALDAVPPIRAVVELLEGEARRRGIRLTLRCDGDVPRIEADSDAIQQLALNLLRNALDATPAGGQIEVAVTRATFTGAGSPVECLRLRFADTGAGMDDATRAHAFEPFFSTRTAQDGTGLGLAVVKGIVDEHCGRIEMSSEPGRGTVFVVELPALRGHAHSAPVERIVDAPA